MVKNKRGWLRIMEATIAITILAGVLITIYSVNRSPVDLSESVYVLQDEFLRDVENSYNYRQWVLNEDISNLTDLASGYFPSYLNYSIVLCGLTEEVTPCKLDGDTYLAVQDKNLYVSQTIIATDIETYSPKILKIYNWEV